MTEGSTRGTWLQVNDRESFGESGATVCSICHFAMNNGYYFEPEEFKYCPNCGSRMIRESDRSPCSEEVGP